MHLRFLAVAFALIGGITLLACNSTEKNTARTATPSLSPVAIKQQPPAIDDGVRRITTIEVQDLLAKNEAVVFDVRDQASYDQGHIKGAKLIPYGQVASRVSEFPRDKLIVTYCS